MHTLRSILISSLSLSSLDVFIVSDSEELSEEEDEGKENQSPQQRPPRHV